MANPYNEDFFNSLQSDALNSAQQIVPFISKLTGCRSVVDVGCGAGVWLSVFREQNITDIRGVDGDYVNQEKLAIPRELFVPADLSQPLKADRRFDLAISLEVAEHLPKSHSGSFVDLLTGFSPLVLFSASLPFQEGTSHVNEQWIEYWVDLFQQRGYVAIDCIRPRFWSDPKVSWWYAQNTVLYVSEKHLADYPQLEPLLNGTKPPVTWVHPKFLVYKENRLQQLPKVKDVWKSAFVRSWKAALFRLTGRKNS